ncbi:flagellar motor protein [Tepidibacillus sp. HK-1]|uniref:flagellar motor protein n=1 Tax=Tepidibacillus sp. HK-1 TaxID=1883407 RepID=UPI000852DD6A|nr:flagellar motor protein [Tepidibacillus sp. HK-1]GBF10457.1 chemotaxis protein PomA [Tepidibacillus sp. HK-1]
MDLSTIIGLILGFAGLIGGFILEGGHFTSLLQITAFMIVFGGTFGAVIVSFPMSQLKTVPKLLNIAFTERKLHVHESIRQLVDFSSLARREGILALEQRYEDLKGNPFLSEGLMMVVDGVDPQLIREILEIEISNIEARHEKGIKIFESAGGFAPTMGIIGTVMGLVHVLGNLSNPDELGPSIAVAFIATLYGVASANVIYLPIAAKLKARSQMEVLIKEIEVEGILSIQAGENPQMLKKKLLAFLPPAERIDDEENPIGDNNE